MNYDEFDRRRLDGADDFESPNLLCCLTGGAILLGISYVYDTIKEKVFNKPAKTKVAKEKK